MVKLWSSKPPLRVRILLPLFALLVRYLYQFFLNFLCVFFLESKHIKLALIFISKFLLFNVKLTTKKNISYFDLEKNFKQYVLLLITDTFYIFFSKTNYGFYKNFSEVQQITNKLKTTTNNRFYNTTTNNNTKSGLYLFGILSI